jgi:arylsulfatase A-like enzyme
MTSVTRARRLVLVLLLPLVAAAWCSSGDSRPSIDLTTSQSKPAAGALSITAKPRGFSPTSVEFRVDSDRAEPVVDDHAPFELALDAASLARGPHRVFVSAPDGSSNVTSSTRFDAAGRPNIIYVMADDMRYDEMDRVADLKPGGGFDWMRRHSTTFSKMWMNDNLCCPSRATALTGQTSFNTHVFDNQTYKDLENTLPMWLQKAGYCTGFTGKYLNLYNARRPRPRGWTYWQPLVQHFQLEHGYTMLNRKGQEVRPGDFITDRLAATSRAQVEDCLDAKKPTFVTFWPFAPHIGSNPEPDYANVQVPWAPTDPSFNEADISDKPGWLQSWFPTPRANAEQWYANWSALRVRTLFSVDDGLKSLIDTVEARGELDHTIFVLTSDNGWFLGEHRIDSRKRLAYEAGQVALWIAGPGFEPGSANNAFVTNLDLVPTFTRASGAKPGLALDGRAIQGILREHDLGRDRYFPIYVPTEPGDAKNQPTGTGVRTWRYKYVRYHDGSEELYDLATDPYELTNVATEPQSNEVRVGMKRLMEQGRQCHGTSCRASAPPSLR